MKRRTSFRRDLTDGLDGLDRLMDGTRGLETLKDLRKGRKRKRYEEGEVLFREGDALDHLPYIVKGKVRTSKMNKDEKEFNTGFYGPADFLGFTGLLEAGRATECAVSLEATEVVTIPREEMLALLHRDPDVSCCFIKLLAHEVEEKKVHLLQLAYASIRQRVAQSVLRIHDRYATADESGLGIRISREDLASVIGTATETLIRCLSDLKEETMISVEGRDTRILDKARLGLQRGGVEVGRQLDGLAHALFGERLFDAALHQHRHQLGGLRGQDAAYLAQFDAFQKASGTEAMQRSAMEAMLDLQEQDPSSDKEVLKRFGKEVIARLGELNAEIAVLYHERFSLEELQEMTRFQETPLGRKLARENPSLVEGSTRIGAAWGERVANDVLQGMR